MKDKINQYLEEIFLGIPGTKQLAELKEEIRSNILASIEDFISQGKNEEEAFVMAIDRMGDMGELTAGLKDTSYQMQIAGISQSRLDIGHVIGYVVATVILLFGVLVTAVVFTQGPELIARGQLPNIPEIKADSLFGYSLGIYKKTIMGTLGVLFITLMTCVPIYTFLGLTQDSEMSYPMNKKRAAVYTVGVEAFLFGGFGALFTYMSTGYAFTAIAVLIPFWTPAVGMFVYLGLTEKSRIKMNEKWAQNWVAYYNNPKIQMLRGTVSGALWILALAAVVTVIMTAGFKFAWIPFVIAIAIQVVLEGVFNMAASQK